MCRLGNISHVHVNITDRGKKIYCQTCVCMWYAGSGGGGSGGGSGVRRDV